MQVPFSEQSKPYLEALTFAELRCLLKLEYFDFVYLPIKEMVHAFSRAYIESWMHLESLRSTQEAIVALGYRPRATLTFLSCSPNFRRASITRYTHAMHEPILYCARAALVFILR